MSTQTYSRQCLREMPEVYRKEKIQRQVDDLFGRIAPALPGSALRGKTTYLYDMAKWTEEQQRREGQQLYAESERQMRIKNGWDVGEKPIEVVEATAEQLLEGLKEKFPDCAVSFQEDWMETRQGVKELKKGILIDWS